MPPSADYIRFDEIEDVLASVDLVALLAPLVREKPQLWKWLIVGAHDAFQGAMVSAFRDSTGTSILTKESAAQVLDWHNADVSTRGEHPKERLASFGELLNRCIAGAPHFEPLALSPDKLEDHQTVASPLPKSIRPLRPNGMEHRETWATQDHRNRS